MAGLPIDLAGGDAIAGGDCAVGSDATEDEGELGIALPVGKRRGHGNPTKLRDTNRGIVTAKVRVNWRCRRDA